MNNVNANSQYYTYTRPEMAIFVPKDAKKMLDVGCGEGLFSSQFKGKIETWGIEVNQDIAMAAKKNIDKVIVGDVLEKMSELPNKYFDCIIFNDVLEHMVDPFSVLKQIKNKIKPTGVIIASIPNIRHLSVLRKLLLKRQWKYEDYGIMDRTHLRFFTYKSIISMFNDAGYDIVQIKGINGSTWWKYAFINVLSFGFLWDTRYIQFACVARQKI